MEEKLLSKDLINLIQNRFGIKVSDIKTSLFCVEVGLQPRDLINLVFLIEKKYGIKFTEEELLDENFDCVERIVAIVSSHQI